MYFLTYINVRCLAFAIIRRFDRQYLSISEFTFANIYNLLLCRCVLYIRNSNIWRIENFPLLRLFENSTKLIPISWKVICEMCKIPVWRTFKYVNESCRCDEIYFTNPHLSAHLYQIERVLAKAWLYRRLFSASRFCMGDHGVLWVI